MDKFLERLAELKDKEMTYEQLAIEVGISDSTMYSWTSRANMPKLDNMILLSNYFKCSIEYLIGRSEDNSELQPKECPPFHLRLISILDSRGLKKTHLRNKNIISRGLAESIFEHHSSPHMENVIKIADYLKLSVDELVGRV
ncbi:MAG: helix-turn-helix transcriptional regulator [Clostridia bacterium]|nr:helix-turn-helix transcriptional regulator [Clostridia bacterium]